MMPSALKEAVQHALIRGLGFERYLFCVSQARIRTIAAFGYQKDFLHFTKMIPASSVILDIGANIGVTTYFLTRNNPTCTVHSFEPIPDNFRTLRKVAAHYKLSSVTLHECGLGEKNGPLPMVMPWIHGIPRHALCQVDNGHCTYEGTRFTVAIRRLDDIEELYGRSDVKAIKIDVEDFEHPVFLGGLQLIHRCRPIVFCELWESENKRRVLQLFHEMDYRVETFEGRASGNYFLIPQEWL
jgi:FkbM family methyltransferase